MKIGAVTGSHRKKGILSLPKDLLVWLRLWDTWLQWLKLEIMRLCSIPDLWDSEQLKVSIQLRELGINYTSSLSEIVRTPVYTMPVYIFWSFTLVCFVSICLFVCPL